MKRTSIGLLIFGIVIGLLLALIPRLYYEMGHFLSSEPVILSTDEIANRINSEGVQIPGTSCKLNYHWISSIDHDCWYAFSADRNSVAEFIERAKSAKELEISAESFPDNRPYVWDDKSFDAIWWPKDFSGFKIYKSRLFWLAHDTEQSRVYVYSFSM